ncbi:MAG TPA: hypothetical protein VGQ69_09985 [Gemmatimonadales bacterium]|jgi:hypothetical protein|nr:hypothetical protein [Gemmatimonadales bacterium]
MSAVLTALAVSMSALTPPAAARPETGAATASSLPAGQSIERSGFHDAMRKLWEDHITWTRLYIVSAVAGLPDAQPAAQRLLRNQADIGDAIRPFYGAAAGDRLTALLRSHILIAADLVTAAKAGNTAGTQAASALWDGNAVEIADFLSDANPAQWPRATLRAEMRHHLELTLREAQARLKSDWAADIAAYDEIHMHILGLADVLAAGIIQQFPQKFGR